MSLATGDRGETVEHNDVRSSYLTLRQPLELIAVTVRLRRHQVWDLPGESRWEESTLPRYPAELDHSRYRRLSTRFGF